MKLNTLPLCTLLVTALRRPIVQVSQRKIALFIYLLRLCNEPAAATELIPAQVKFLRTGQSSVNSSVPAWTAKDGILGIPFIHLRQ